MASNKPAPKANKATSKQPAKAVQSKAGKGKNGGGNYAQSFNAIDKAMRNDVREEGGGQGPHPGRTRPGHPLADRLHRGGAGQADASGNDLETFYGKAPK